jgi:TctA family transporter
VILAILLGIGLGIITGVLPGIGVGSLLLAMYMLLGHFSILELFIFYSVLMTTLQYYGNVPSIIYGIYGEMTSGPAVKHGHALFRANTKLGIDALIYSATGSLIASMLALSVMAMAFQYAPLLVTMFGNTAKVIVTSVAILLLILTTQNKIWGILAAILGVVAGKVGYDPLFNMRFLSGYDSNVMDGGIPMVTVFTGLLAIPQLWIAFQQNNTVVVTKWQDTDFAYRIQKLVSMPYYMSAVRGSILGIITGLIPGVSYVISSTVANSVEEKLCKRQEETEINTQYRCVVSAESANNSASMIVLIPLLVMALPIIPSEAILYSLAERAGFGYGTSYAFLLEYGYTFVTILLIVNLVNWIMAGVFYNHVSKIFSYMKSYVYKGLFVFIILVTILSASKNNQILITMGFLCLFTFVGVLIKDIPVKTTMLFSFFLSDTIVNEYYRFYLLNF